PPGLTVDDLRITGGRADVQPDGAAQIVYNGAVPPGQSWEITVDMPPGATNAVTPRWQQEVARVAAEAEAAAVTDARLRLGFGAASVLILVLGVAALIGIWYTWGRDRPLPEVADYLPEPPSDLPPGIVAY